MQAVIGLDFGTQSARAILVDAETGETLCSHTVAYPHGVMEGDLASVQDYEFALLSLLEAVTPAEYRENIVGICVDATSFTLVPVGADGKALATTAEFGDRYHAQIKLWKHHAAQAQAEEALALARSMELPVLGRIGGSISCEWALPKLMQMRDEDRQVYDAVDMALDLCEFLTYRLTGLPVRSTGSMSFKGLWASDLGFPPDEYLNSLRPGIAAEYRHKMRGVVKCPGQKAGYLQPAWATHLGLKDNVVVAAGTLDGHTALVALGALEAGDATLVIGTSNVVAIQSKQLREIPGVCGVAKDGFTEGLYGIDSGQSGTGDMLDWFVHNVLPEEIVRQAEQRNVSPHQVLIEQIERPWENTVIATDWWNGSRNVLCDLSLPGALIGMSLTTQAKDIYLALLQSIACGTREILEQCEVFGVSVEHLLVTGGIAMKNPLLMQEYANLLHRRIYVGQAEEGPALGAAILAAVAVGLYETPMEAYRHIGVRRFVCYIPNEQHREAYEDLYRRNRMLRQIVSTWKNEANCF